MKKKTPWGDVEIFDARANNRTQYRHMRICLHRIQHPALKAAAERHSIACDPTAPDHLHRTMRVDTVQASEEVGVAGVGRRRLVRPRRHRRR